MIVDLAVENDVNRSVFVADGLPAIFQVDDAQTAAGQGDVVSGKIPVRVRTAMADCVRHPANKGQGISVFQPGPANSAHRSTCLLFTGTPQLQAAGSPGPTIC